MIAIAVWIPGCAATRGPESVPASHTLLPGTHISLALPDGFRHDPRLGAFASADERTAIFASELPGSVYGTLRTFSAEEFQKNGMMLHALERATVDDWPARLYRATQPVTGADLLRLVLVFGDSETSVILTAVTPDAERNAELTDVLLSARWHRHGVVGTAGP
jgi:hypothetical protein